MKATLRKMFAVVMAATLAVLASGCVCSGHETSFLEVDRKYANSGWTAAANYVPIFGQIFIMPALLIEKDLNYMKVLHKKPTSEAYEKLRYDNRFWMLYLPDDMLYSSRLP